MNTTRLYLCFLSMLFALSASAQSISLQVRDEVEQGMKFSLTVSMKNMDVENVPAPLTLSGCTFIYGPSISNSYQSVFVNGKQSETRAVNATYTYRADEVGSITIPAITVTDKSGKKFSTNAKTIKVVPAGQRRQMPQYQPRNPVDLPDGSKINTDGIFSKDDFFVRINVDKHSVYEQEPVVATITLYSRQNISAFQLLTQPTFEGFLSEELDVDVSSSVGRATVNDKEYATQVLKKCVLYPQKTGKLKLTSGTFDVTLYDRVYFNTGTPFQDFRVVEKQIKTPESVATIDVRPLPSPKPEGFDGAVGNFTADVQLSSTALHTNEPVTYTYTITGTGNIKYLKTPTINFPPGIDQYTPKTDIDAKYSGGNMTGTYRVTYTLVPQEVGSFEIPPAKFAYFDPKAGEYKSMDLRGFDVRVAKGLSSGPTEQKTIAKGMTDILHIKPIGDKLTKHPSYVFRQGWYWTLYALITLALIVVVFAYRRQLRLNADVRGRQLARALKKAMKRFRTARSMMGLHNSEMFYAEISKALWGYLSDKLGIPASQLVRDNIAAQLAEYGVDQAGIDNVIAILDECEMARFTPMHSDTDMSQLYEKVVNAVKSIENVKK